MKEREHATFNETFFFGKEFSLQMIYNIIVLR